MVSGRNNHMEKQKRNVQDTHEIYEQPNILVEDEDTIYEIDGDCISDPAVYRYPKGYEK